MKPKNRFLSASPIVLAVSSVLAGMAAAQSGTWTSLTTAGNWSNVGNWNNGAGPIADGSGNTADFSTVDLPAGAFTVNLDTARTISSLNFNDTDAVTTAGTWLLAGANMLTLAGGTPTITAGVTTTINPVLSGTAGLTKSGAGNVILTSDNNQVPPLTGNISVTTGQLTTKNGLALGLAANNTLTLANGTHYRYERTPGNGSTFQGNPITVAAASSVTITSDNAANGYSGVITGDAASTVTIGATGLLAQCSFGAGSSIQQFGPFLGRVEIFDGASIRFSSTGAVNNGGAAAIWDTNTTGFITTRNSATVNFGTLVGNGTVAGSGGANGTAIFSIGARNEDSVFGGIIQDSNADRKAAVTKVGTGKLTLTGTNNYTGNTNVTAGTLEIGDGGATGTLAGITNIAVTSDLVFNTGGTQTISGIISGAGNITKKGTGTTLLTGVNTFTVGPFIEGGRLAINADSGLGDAANTVTFQNGSGKLASDVAGLVTARGMTVAAGATGGFAAIDATDSIEIGGAVTGAGALEIGGGGLVRLAVASSYDGNTTVTSGILDVGVAGATSGGSVAVTGGVLAGTGSVTGAVSVSSGAGIKAGAITTTSTSSGTLSTGSLTLAGGSTLYTEFTNSTTFDKLAVTGNVATTGASVATPVLVDLRLENSVAKWTTLGSYNLIQYSGTFTGNANDLFEVSPGSIQAGLTYTFAASGGFVTLTISGSAPSEWNVDANGNWSLAGNWLNGIPNAVGVTAKFGIVITTPRTVNVDSARTVGAIQFNNANSYSISGASALTLNATTGNAGIEILAGNHGISAPLSLTDSLDVSLASAANTLTLAGNISGAGGINNATAGTVVLTGTNTFGGAIVFSGGNLRFESGALGNGSLSLADTTLVWEGTTENISSRTVSMDGTSVTLDTNGNNVLLTNAIGNGGSANLIKAGEGKLTFAADPTYTGSTTISAGILELGNGGTTGLVSGTIVNNAELSVKLAAASVLPNLVTGTGSFVHSGAGVLTLSSQNTFSGTTSISSGSSTLALGDPLSIQNSTLSYFSSGGSVSFGAHTAVTLGGLSDDKGLALENDAAAALILSIGNNGQSSNYTGVLSGAGSLVKLGIGISSLGGANTYAGSTTVSAGDLELPSGGEIHGAGVITNGTGRMVISGGLLNTTTGAFGVSSGGFTMSDGTATFSGAVTANGSNGSSVSAPLLISGGVFTAPSINLGRTGANVQLEPTEAPMNTNLYVSGGEVNLTGNLDIGTTAASNSTVVTRVDGGSLTVAGVTTIAINNGGRWSILDINGGAFTSPDTVSGILVGGGTVGKSALLVRSGILTAERIQIGQGALDGTGLVNLIDGETYLGSGGIVDGSTGAAHIAELRLSGGTLAAKADWASSVPVNVADLLDKSILKAANANGDPFNFELSGAVTGIGGLEKIGSGTVTLSGGHSHTGETVVSEGTLRLTTRTFADVALVTIADGATLNLDYSGGDRIQGLTINGGTMPDGIYGRVGTNVVGVTETAAITGNGRLYVNVDVPGGSPYDTWAAANGLNGTNDGPLDDPDKDGVTNVLEFVLGGNPSLSSPDVLPDLVVNPTSFIFTFTRNDDSELEVALAFQWGATLATWSTPVVIGTASTPANGNGVTVDVNEGIPATNPDVITVTVPRTNAVAGKLFGRLQAVK